MGGTNGREPINVVNFSICDISAVQHGPVGRRARTSKKLISLPDMQNFDFFTAVEFLYFGG